nr:DUF6636 domain-containing protein [uncultured Rhodococcus sp.]
MNVKSNNVVLVASAVAAGALLAGCGGESGANVSPAAAAPQSTTSMTTTTLAPPPSIPAPVLTTEDVPPPLPQATEPEVVPAPQTTYAALDAAHYFSSPDGRFQCGIVTLASRTEAGCQGVTTPVPPRPEECMINWGNGIRVTNNDAAQFMCAGGAVYTSGGDTIDPPLGVGQQIQADGYTCKSTPDGIACANDSTGHGFRIAPDSNETF